MLEFRRFDRSDIHRLRHFRCAEKSDTDFAKRVNYLIKKELVPVLYDQTRDQKAFVGVDGEKLFGVVALELNEADIWEVTALGVSVHARNLGVGRALLQLAVSDTPEAWGSPILFSVHHENVNMRRLLNTFRSEQVSSVDSDGYITLLADAPALTHNADLALDRAASSVARRFGALDPLPPMKVVQAAILSTKGLDF